MNCILTTKFIKFMNSTKVAQAAAAAAAAEQQFSNL